MYGQVIIQRWPCFTRSGSLDTLLQIILPYTAGVIIIITNIITNIITIIITNAAFMSR